MITEKKQFKLKDLKVDVVRKDIKNVHLSVYPPSGRVRISAPFRMSLDTLRIFAISKLSWIRKQQKKFKEQLRESSRDFVQRESHYFFGKRYLLKVIEHDAPPKVELKHDKMFLYVRPDSNIEKKREVLEEFYRQSLKELIPRFVSKYEKIMGVKVKEFGVKKMRTKWGTCSRDAGRIWLNLELAKKPKHFTEYIVVHEMIHLVERRHSNIFFAYLDKFVPNWRSYKAELNRSELGHVDWVFRFSR
jgi:predicted metal-dependent hydrolase